MAVGAALDTYLIYRGSSSSFGVGNGVAATAQGTPAGRLGAG